MTVEVGVTLPQFTDDPDVLKDGARRAEELGLDSIWVFDHLWPLTGKRQRPMFEGWTTLAWLAAATERIRLGTLVTRSSLRHPALLATIVATAGEIAPGRVIVGIGSGDESSRDENEAFGILYYSGPDRLAQLAETVEVLTRSREPFPVTARGRVIAIENLPVSPRPTTWPPVWVGGLSADALEIAGRHADGWNGWGLGAIEFGRRAAELRAAAGRHLELTWAGLVILADDDDQARAKLGERDPSGYLVGGPDTVAAALADLAAAGAGHLVLTFPDADRPGPYELLAGEVLPRLRARGSRG